MKNQLTTTQSKKKLVSFLAIVSENKRRKDESQMRRSVGVLPPNTLMSGFFDVLHGLYEQVQFDVLPPNTTITLMSAKARKPSPELASCPPWSQDTRPRYHEDPVTAITSLNATLGISES